MSNPRSHYGRRLLLQVLDDLACKTPERPYAAIPTSSRLEDGFRDITFKDIVHCVDCMCWWLLQHLPPGDISFDTICYLGAADLRYVICFYAAVKCGYKVPLLVFHGMWNCSQRFL